ncbi:MAG: TMEM165/GDT1 family protein [Lautropia sp.]|nr:TMEM165/GDT1 family protein [Lautropia sp.]
MEAFLISTGVVTLAEIGDKTQLLALLLAARYRQPIPIIAGILIATLVNHALAGALGALIHAWVSPGTLRWLLGLSFLIMAAWMMIPDDAPTDEVDKHSRLGVFGATLLAFFLAEMGDKTQVATVALALRYEAMLAVVLGTTVGMMLANVPAVLLGDKLANRLPTRWVHAAAALIFVLLGIGSLTGLAERWLG